MINPVIINGKKYLTVQDKELLIGKSFKVKIENIALIDRKTRLVTQLYDYYKVREAYRLKRQKRINIIIPKFVSDKVHSILKDYAVYRMEIKDICKKYNLSNQRINYLLNKYVDKAKGKYENLLEDNN